MLNELAKAIRKQNKGKKPNKPAVVDGEFKFKDEVVRAQRNRTKEVGKPKLFSLQVGTKDSLLDGQ